MTEKTLNTAFKFNDKNILKAKNILNNYPKQYPQSAVLPFLHLAQEQLNGWLNKSSIEYISKFLKIPLINVYEVASFYHMFNLRKVGKHCIHVCTTTPCWLRGSDIILRKLERKLNLKIGETTKDNLFTLNETECLGACIDAPVIKIDDEYYENLKIKDIDNLISKMKK